MFHRPPFLLCLPPSSELNDFAIRGSGTKMGKTKATSAEIADSRFYLISSLDAVAPVPFITDIPGPIFSEVQIGHKYSKFLKSKSKLSEL